MVETNETKEEEKIPTSIERAEALAERLEAANEKNAEILKEQQDIRAEQILSGRSEAGTSPPQEKEETAKEYANKVMSGEIKGK
jgi:hypothetical protein|tara:strand:- start:1954 stop:2205 length:252 start_codon:yes stop_codon:yes gene_type:complete